MGKQVQYNAGIELNYTERNLEVWKKNFKFIVGRKKMLQQRNFRKVRIYLL